MDFKRYVIYSSLLLLILIIQPLRAQNLIQNPGCEDTLVNGEIPYWVEVIGTNWTQRSSNPSPYEGSYYFFAGVASVAELQQDVNVSAFGDMIDNQNQSFIFEGYVRSWPQTPSDESRIMLEYLDTLKTTVLDTFDSGNFSDPSVWTLISDTTLAPVGTRFIRIRLISTRNAGSNNDGYYDGLSLIASSPVSVPNNELNIPTVPTLEQNYPNPFNPVTTIRYALPKSSIVKIEVFDVSGQTVSTLVDKRKSPGYHRIDFDGRGFASGIYIYRIQAGEFAETKKMILMR